MVVGIKIAKCGPTVKSNGVVDYMGLNYINKFPSTGANKGVCWWWGFPFVCGGWAVLLGPLICRVSSNCMPILLYDSTDTISTNLHVHDMMILLASVDGNLVMLYGCSL